MFPLGDSAIVIQFGKNIDPKINRKVKILSVYLDENSFTGMVEYVPAFTTVTVYYDPLQLHSSVPGYQSPYECVSSIMAQIVASLEVEVDFSPRKMEIPVCYGGDFGPDLQFVGEHNGLTPEEVIEIHSNGEYLVYMIGFAPGFPFLGGMSNRIATPRRSSPRVSIPKGTVAIGGMQTGVYPIESPGGWHLIGRTPLPLFRSNDTSPSFLQAGDIIRFRPISLEEYEALEGNNRWV